VTTLRRVPDAKTALLVVDMITSYDFDDGDKLADSAREAVPSIAKLIERAGAEGVDVIYVNDNYGDWRSSSDQLVEKALESEHGDLLEPIAPDDDSMFVLKPRHTCFYETPLEYLLGQRDIDRVVLTGQATEQCIVYSALDAYVRHFQVAVPTDAVAHIHADLAQAALKMMELNMKAEIAPAADVRLS
jgi:nicotinamidase-related amidase